MSTDITVCVLTYNRANLLKKAIDSILNQTFSDFALFVIDNHSEDHTYDVVKSYSDSRLKYLRHERNIGGKANIEYALDHFNSKYLIIFHDDDEMEEDFIETEYRYMENNPNVVAVAGNATIINELGKTVKISSKNKNTNIYKDGKLINAYLSEGKYLNFPSLMYRSDFLRKHSIHIHESVGPCCDVILYCDIEKYGGIVAELPDCILKSRYHGGQDSTRNLCNMHLQLLDYMIKTPYYKNALFANQNRVSFAERILKFLILDYLNDKVTRNELIQEVNEILNRLNLHRINVWKIMLVYIIVCICPVLSKKAYKLKYVN